MEHPYEDCGKGRIAPYPYEFDPTFHRYKLDEPQHWKKPHTIFVCSMADLFGEWVPDEWIEQVFKACEAAPQHRYMFLTKNPARFKQLRKNGVKLPNDCWIGTSVTRDAEQADQYTGRTGYLSENWDTTAQWFVSVEPILERMSRASIENLTAMNWVIVGAETGRRNEKVIPEKKWIDEIAEECKRCGTPIFMKESLRGLMGADFRQEFPWEV
jgi:protein gp37